MGHEDGLVFMGLVAIQTTVAARLRTGGRRVWPRVGRHWHEDVVPSITPGGKLIAGRLTVGESRWRLRGSPTGDDGVIDR